MKVDPKAQLAQVTATRAQPFKQLLAEARSELKKDTKPPALPVVIPAMRAAAKSAISAATATATSTTAQTLGRARTQANSEVQRLGVVRTEAQEVTKVLTQVRSERNEVVQEKTEARILDFILKEFGPEATQPRGPQVEASTPPCFIGPEASVHHLHPGPSTPLGVNGPAPKLEAPPEAKAAQAVALIERIELFVRSQRPGLALTLNNSLGAHVEIERIGPKEIALKLVGHRGPPTAEAVSRIRDELRARGLKVGALSVA